MIAEKYNTNNHFVKRRLIELGVKITNECRLRKPYTEEHRRKISETSKGRQGFWKVNIKKKITLYENMLGHLRWVVDLEFLMQFEDIEKLKCLNKLLGRDRVGVHFDVEKYKAFIQKIYFDKKFNKQFEIFKSTQNKYDRPLLDHILPLSRGETWDLNNLQIMSWFENRAKCDMTQEEFEKMKQKYFDIACDRVVAAQDKTQEKLFA